MTAAVIAVFAQTPPTANAALLRLGEGGWTWLAEPRAVRASGATITGWVSPNGDIVVARVRPPAGVRRVVVARRFQRNDHANPAIARLANGRVMVAFSKHGGGFIVMRTTRRGSDVRTFGRSRYQRSIVPGIAGATYPNIVRLADDRLALNWRGGNSQPAMRWGDASGSSWSPAHTWLLRRVRRPYAVFAPSRACACIHVAYNESNPNAQATPLRYVQVRRGGIYRADGTRIGEELPQAAEAGDLVFGGGGERSWVYDVADDGSGNPRIAFATMPADLATGRYHVASWKAGAWTDADLIDTGGRLFVPSVQAGGIALDPDTPTVAALSRRTGPGKRLRIELWRTIDDGSSWSRIGLAPRRPTMGDAFRPTFVNNDPGQTLLWMSGPYLGYRAFGGSIWHWDWSAP